MTNFVELASFVDRMRISKPGDVIVDPSRSFVQNKL